MFKLWHSCTYFAQKQGHAQNSPSESSKYVNQELPDVQAGFRKARGTRDQIVNIKLIIEIARIPDGHLLLLQGLC